MASAVTLGELSDILECAICLETVEDPKMLVCNHSYCKRCLDGLLRFGSNGSAVIKCPKSCKDGTTITQNETTNDLGVDYMLKRIIDVMKTKNSDKKEITCGSKEDCSRKIDGYCVPCDTFICTPCTSMHDICLPHSPIIPISFNHQDNELNILCKKHETEATYVCCNDEFICLYCLHRSHQGHWKITFENQVSELKETLSREIEQIDSFIENINVKLHAVECAISASEQGLRKLLKKRKIKCISDYINHLNQEEEQIMKEFDSLATHHMEGFFIADPTEAYKKYLTKGDMNILMQKHPITSSIKELGIEKTKSVKEVTVSLNDNAFNSKHPLGYMHVAYGKTMPVNKAKNTFKGKFGYEMAQDKPDKLLQDVKNLCQDFSVDVSKKLCTTDYKQTKRQDLSPRHSLRQKQFNAADTSETSDDTACGYSNSTAEAEGGYLPRPVVNKAKKDNALLSECLEMFNERKMSYIEGMIQKGMNNELTLLLRERPEIFYLRSNVPPFHNRPIHMAAKYNNLTFLKALLNHDKSMLIFKNHIGSNLLHAAVSYTTAFDCFTWLIETFPNILEDKNDNGHTPLHVAASRNVTEAVKALITKRVNIWEKDNDEKTPLDLAKGYNCHEIADMLESMK